MDFGDILTVKLNIQGMKDSILHHLCVLGSDLEKALDEKITQAINDYDFDTQVNNIVRETITQSLESYFRYGPGREIIESTIKEKLDKTLASFSSRD